MSEKIKQRSIEQYFSQYGVSDPDQKVKLIPNITKIIYERNMHIAKYEREEDPLKKQQELNDANELEQKIDEIFKDFLGK